MAPELVWSLPIKQHTGMIQKNSYDDSRGWAGKGICTWSKTLQETITQKEQNTSVLQTGETFQALSTMPCST